MAAEPIGANVGDVVSDRRNAILRLLDARFDGLPEPRSVTLRTQPGFVHRTLAPTVCETCEGVDSYGCTGCGGRGSVERMRERDPMAVDTIQPYGLTPDRRDAELERDRQIATLTRQIRPAREVDEAAEAASSPFAWERARNRLYATTDLACLDRCVEWLRDLLPGVRLHGNLALAFLDVVLPVPLRAPEPSDPSVNMLARGRHADKGAMWQRDAEIRRLAKHTPIPELESRFGLKKSVLYEIINKEAA